MKYMYCCYGGSGSTHLYRSLKGIYAFMAGRPETYFLPEYFPKQKKSATKRDQQTSFKGYDDLPSKTAIQGFYRRSGFLFDSEKSINDNLVAYVKNVLKYPSHNVMFSRAPMFGFFSRNKINGVIFVVRHPVHQYISLTKHQRHYEFVEDYGGVNTEGGVNFWIKEWGSYVRDALESGSHIVRYEFAQEDAKKTRKKAVNKIFSSWVGNSRNAGVLNKKYESMMRDGLKDLYNEVYDSWNI